MYKCMNCLNEIDERHSIKEKNIFNCVKFETKRCIKCKEVIRNYLYVCNNYYEILDYDIANDLYMLKRINESNVKFLINGCSVFFEYLPDLLYPHNFANYSATDIYKNMARYASISTFDANDVYNNLSNFKQEDNTERMSFNHYS